MKDAPQDYMHVGLVLYMLHPRLVTGRGPLLDTLGRLCNDDYFQALEVTSHEDAQARSHAAELAQGAGKRVLFNAQPAIRREKLNLQSLAPEERIRALDIVKSTLTEAIEWNAEAFLVMSGPDPGEAARDAAREVLIGALKEICEFSRISDGPVVLLENYERWPAANNCLIGPTREARGVAHRIVPYYPRFGMALDLAQLALLSEDSVASAKIAAPHLKYAQIGNCVRRDPEHPAYGNEHPAFGAETGEISLDDLAIFLRGLLEIGYLRPGGTALLAIEVQPFGNQTAQQALDLSKRALDAAWKRV